MNKSTYFYIYAPQLSFDKENQVLLYYHGPFNSAIISKMANGLKSQLSCPKRMAWKVFSVFVELIQNIYFHASEFNTFHNNEPVGIVFIEENEKEFEITAANLATSSALDLIQERCDYINQLSVEELRVYKNELLLKSIEEHYKGGNIGLVQIALISQQKINLQVKPINQANAFFSLTTTIKKNEQ